jgi:6,7-dimethyl-8-ribityllumazine synthase
MGATDKKDGRFVWWVVKKCYFCVKKKGIGTMGALKFGFVIVEGCGEQTMIAEHTLHQMVEVEGEVEYRLVPGTGETPLAAKCFAELTSVDAVLVFLPTNEHSAVLSAALNGLTEVVLDWNMPIVTTISYPDGVSLARAAVTMVGLQMEMESRAERTQFDTSVN